MCEASNGEWGGEGARKAEGEEDEEEEEEEVSFFKCLLPLSFVLLTTG